MSLALKVDALKLTANLACEESPAWRKCLRLSMPCLALAAFMMPFALHYWGGRHLMAIGSEFIFYRIGDALSLHLGEGGNVLPVQGLVNALVSKVIVAGLYSWGVDLVTYDGIQAYCVAFYGVTFVLFGIAFGSAWLLSGLTTTQRISVCLLPVAPLYIGGPSLALYMSAEYWLFEGLYLTYSLLFLFRFPAQPRAFHWAAFGAWSGLGMLTKVSLLGVPALFLVLVLYHRPHFAPWGVPQFLLSSAITYSGVIVLYAGWHQAMRILAFQLQFFIRPNPSLMFDDLSVGLARFPIVTVGLGLFALWACAFLLSSRPWGERLRVLVLLAWMLAFVYLVHKRPHDSSMSSWNSAILFSLLATLPLYARTAPIALSITSCVLLLAGWSSGFKSVETWLGWANSGKAWQTYVEAEQDWLAGTQGEPSIWFVPINALNAGCLPQGFGFNGGLALTQVQLGPQGTPRLQAQGQIFQELFHGAVIAGHSEKELLVISKCLHKGICLLWTEPVPLRPNEPCLVEDVQLIRQLVAEAGLTVEERLVNDPGGSPWRFVKAQLVSSAATRMSQRPVSHRTGSP